MSTDLWTLALVLFAGHFICDYAFQSEYMSKVKNPFDSNNEDKPTRLILLGHASIHGAFVALVTGWTFFGYVELISHYAIDQCKCRGMISLKEDQYVHIFFKVLYFIAIAFDQWLKLRYG